MGNMDSLMQYSFTTRSPSFAQCVYQNNAAPSRQRRAALSFLWANGSVIEKNATITVKWTISTQCCSRKTKLLVFLLDCFFIRSNNFSLAMPLFISCSCYCWLLTYCLGKERTRRRGATALRAGRGENSNKSTQEPHMQRAPWCHSWPFRTIWSLFSESASVVKLS